MGADAKAPRELVLSWGAVTVKAAVGSRCGVVTDVDGRLTLVVAGPGEPWPHGLEPLYGAYEIGPGNTCYTVDTMVPVDRPPDDLTAADRVHARAWAARLGLTPGRTPVRGYAWFLGATAAQPAGPLGVLYATEREAWDALARVLKERTPNPPPEAADAGRDR